MKNMKTKIFWSLNNYCKAKCTYCPATLWGGEEPRHISEYIDLTQRIIDHYALLGREIEWTFDGGEPLDMFDFPMLLKMCKEANGTITLNSNGGRLWMDWWAIEPHVDLLNLTYHYWQNPKLIEFIISTFKNKNKSINVTVPIRPDFFDQDLSRAISMEEKFGIWVHKSALYNHCDTTAGLFPYTKEQLEAMSKSDLIPDPPPSDPSPSTMTLIEQQEYFENTTFHERYNNSITQNPVFTNWMCNAGIETLSISHLGWASGSNCNNIPLGNVWNSNFQLPSTPQRCGMLACISHSDQQITKFKE